MEEWIRIKKQERYEYCEIHCYSDLSRSYTNFFMELILQNTLQKCSNFWSVQMLFFLERFSFLENVELEKKVYENAVI